MSPEVQSIFDDLLERVKALEQDARRTRRGRTNQRGAAEYLGKSREWLRQLHLRGEGPHRAPDGTYSFDDLDDFAERGPAGCNRAPEPKRRPRSAAATAIT